MWLRNEKGFSRLVFMVFLFEIILWTIIGFVTYHFIVKYW